MADVSVKQEALSASATAAASVEVTPSPEQNSSSENAQEAAPVYPTVVLAVSQGLNRSQVEKQFNGEGFALIFAESEEDVIEAIKKLETYLVFVDLPFGKNGVLLMRSYRQQTNAYWVVITGHLSTQKRSALFQSGAIDLLTQPVGAAQYKLRAKNLLARYLKSFDFPPEVILPAGFARKEEGQVQRGAASENASREYTHRTSESGTTEPEGYHHQKSSTETSQAEGYDHLQGERGGSHEHRYHDLKSDEAKAQHNIHDLSADKNASQHNVRNLTSDQAANWNQNNSSATSAPIPGAAATSNSPSSEVAPTQYKTSGAEKSPDWKSHSSETQGAASSETKYFQKDPPAGSWTNHNTPSAPEKSGETTSFQIGEAKNSTGSHVKENEPAVTSSSHHTSTNEGKSAAASTVGKTDPLPVRKVHPTKPEATPGMLNQFSESKKGSSGKKPQILKDITDSLNLLTLIRERLTKLPSDIPWESENWPSPESIFSEEFKSMEESLKELKKLLRLAAEVLGCQRASLISLRPELPVESLPEHAFALASSDDAIPHNDRFATASIPQLVVAFEDGIPFYLNETVPAQHQGISRTQQWMLRGQIEQLSAIIPIKLDHRVGLALFMQYDQALKPETQDLLEQAVSYFAQSDKHFNVIDFLSRVYRRIQTPKSLGE